MAYFSDASHRNIGAGAWAFSQIATWFSNTAETMIRRRLERETYRELSMLSNHELADLGLSRSELRSIAHEAAYGQL